MCDACLNINEQPTDKGILINAVLQMDPTRTLTLRKKFVADVDKRFLALKKLITVSIVLNDCFGLKPRVTAPTPFFIQAAAKPGQFAFDRSSAKVEGFMAWLAEQEAAGVLQMAQKSRIGGAVEQPWTNIYIDTAYQRGIRRGRQELRNQGVDIPGFGDKQLRDPIMTAFNQPIHADRVGLIYTRAYSDLKGITGVMDTQISRVLAQGIAERRGPRELARTINERVDAIGITRARTLARTEVIRAHHAANIQEYRNAGVEGVSVKAEWSTAGFNVCPICSALQGKVFTLDEIEGMIPKHPNCRCVCLPHLPGISKAPVDEAPGAQGFTDAVSLQGAQRQFSDLFNIDNVGAFGASSLAGGELLQSVNAIGRELQRLELAFPGITKLTSKPLSAAVAPGRRLSVSLGEEMLGGSQGLYTPKLNEMRLGSIGVQTKTPVMGETYSWLSVYNDELSIFRHEYAHAIHAQGLSIERFDQWYALYKSKPVEFWAEKISDYGATSATELFAEAFAGYTSTAYKKGTFPLEVEQFFKEVLK
jgi:SPP1 gp7 family putative phage head morphogenesis protein